jgi:predicted ATPase/class 3 adenylate cyclase
VTLVFSDIQGSADMWEAHGTAFRPVLARHNELMREAAARWHGYEVSTEGDAFFIVFSRASDAVQFAVEAQQALAAEDWTALLPAITSVRVRIGMHTGEPAPVVDGGRLTYYGRPTNRAARVSGAGHGGQILVSEMTRRLAAPALPPEIEFRDMGAHRLKGVGEERLWQVCHPALPDQFPALKTLNTATHNLPLPKTSFVGREVEVEAVCSLLGVDTHIPGLKSHRPEGTRSPESQLMGPVPDPESQVTSSEAAAGGSADFGLETWDVGPRLVTLTGPGGVGKTRLSLQVAQEAIDDFPDGVFFVPLASVREPHLVPGVIARSLGVRESPGQPLEATLQEFLCEKRLLLLLDNMEQVVDAAPLVGDLLATCAGLKVLATSREELRLHGEHEFPVSPLPLPPPGVSRQSAVSSQQSAVGSRQEAEGSSQKPQHPTSSPSDTPPGYLGASTQPLTPEVLSQYGAVELFIQRARMVRPDFRVTNENAPEVAEICSRLDGLPLAIELAAARVKLLTPQALLARLGNRLQMLTGGARDLPARQQTLRATIAWSYDLLEAEEQALFRLLSVFEKGFTLEAAEAVVSGQGRVGEWESGRVGEGLPPPFPHSPTPPLSHVLDGIAALIDRSLLRQEELPDGESRYAMLETIREFGLDQLAAAGELDRARAAHAAYYVEFIEQVRHGLLGGPEQNACLARLDREQENFRAALEWYLRKGEAEAALRLTAAQARYWYLRGRLGEGRRQLEAALALAGMDFAHSTVLSRALHAAAIFARDQGDYARAVELHERTLVVARECGDQERIGAALNSLGSIATATGDYEQARRHLEETVAIYHSMGDEASAAIPLAGLAILAKEQGDRAGARALLEQTIAIHRRTDSREYLAAGLLNLGILLREMEDYGGARPLVEESLALYREQESHWGAAYCLHNLGLLTWKDGNPAPGRSLLEQSIAILREVGDRPYLTAVLHHLGDLSFESSDYPAARSAYTESRAIYQHLGQREYEAWATAALADVEQAAGNPAAARVLYEESLALFRELGHEKGMESVSRRMAGE